MANLMNNTKKRYYLYDMVNCLNEHIAWLLLLVAALCYHRPKSWWRHQMETFSALLALCAGNSPVPVNSPHKGQWRGALMFSLIYAWINDWVNIRDLKRHRGHYDVIVMCSCCMHCCVPSDRNVAVSMVRNWLTYVSGLQLNGYW